LFGDGFIERYDVYRRLDDTESNDSNGTIHKREVIAVDLQIGHRLNGHDKIVHGGILSLLIDEAMGWASYIGLEHYNSNIDAQYQPSNTLLVTANLNIDFRAPYIAGSKAVLRVYLDQELTAGRKMYLVARLESYDGNVTFAEAKSLFLCVLSEKMKGVTN
jgi:acyl-coenzyme A thioesterase PaaI-like protein